MADKEPTVLSVDIADAAEEDESWGTPPSESPLYEVLMFIISFAV